MTDILQTVVRRLERLPAPVQERYARRFLQEIEQGVEEGDGASAEMAPASPDAQPVKFEDIEHLLGVFDGPGDLSTNKAYLDDFGQSSSS